MVRPPHFDEATSCSHRAEGAQWLLPEKAAVPAARASSSVVRMTGIALGCSRARACREHIGETDCMAGVVGFELRCAERKFISLTRRAVSDSSASAETAAVPRENDLLC